MAGDWIKMRTDLRTHPKVARISSALKADRLRVIGGLHAVWCLFDVHSVDGRLEGYTVETLDDELRWPGFSDAMIAVQWLDKDDESLCTPRFGEHNGQSAKRRAQESERKRNERAGRNSSASDADKSVTREEKRREEYINTPIPPSGAVAEKKKPSAISLKTYVDKCKKDGAKSISAEDPVFDYASKAGIPMEFLRLQWMEFEDRYTLPGAKMYKAWPTVFRKSVQGNWFKLWYIGADGNYMLTTQGQQAQRIHADKK